MVGHSFTLSVIIGATKCSDDVTDARRFQLTIRHGDEAIGYACVLGSINDSRKVNNEALHKRVEY